MTYSRLSETWSNSYTEFWEHSNIHFVTYGNEKFKESRKRIMEEALHLGIFKTTKLYTEKDKPKLYTGTSPEFLNVARQPRGDGYWIWKPFVIQDYLTQIPAGDIIFYSDAGSTLTPHPSWKNLQDIQDFVVRVSPVHKNFKEVTTGDMLDLFPEKPDENTLGAGAACMVVKNNPKGRRIIDAWVQTAKDHPTLFDDHESIKPNPPEFLFPRHDQAVLHRICNKYGGLIDDGPMYPWFGEKQGFSATRKRF